MKKIFLSLIRLYQKYLSLDQGILSKFSFSPHCRFTPTCSEFLYQAISKYGIIFGSWKGIRRILRCHPFNKGGYDPLK